MAALQRQAKPSCIKPEHRASLSLTCEVLSHSSSWIKARLHNSHQVVALRSYTDTSWARELVSFLSQVFYFFCKNCWSKMLLAHQQACHSLPVTSIRVSVDPGCLAMHLSTRTASSFPFHHSSLLWMSCSPTTAGRQGTGATSSRGEARGVAGQGGQWSHIFYYVSVCNQGWFQTI